MVVVVERTYVKHEEQRRQQTGKEGRKGKGKGYGNL
jgi:hypothetical protein